MGNGKKAVETLDQALALDPLHEPTILNKVKALLTIGQKAEALELAKSLEKSEDPTIANDASALLAAYH
jgi:tetratricopeptide (TPR) repeat protein